MQKAAARALKGVVINRDYGLFLAGSFVSALGSWLLTVAQGWLVLQLGNSDFLLGLANFAQMAPLLVFGVVGGALADQVDRRWLLIITQTVSFIASAILALLALVGRVDVPAIMAAAFVSGLANAFMWPTWSAFIKDLVGPEYLRAAIATNSTRFNLTRVLGPAIGGVLLARSGAASCLVLGAVSMVGVIAALVAIRAPRQQHAARLAWREVLTTGAAYSWQHREVRGVLLVTAVVALFGSSYQAFLPAFARDVLHTGPQGLGWELGAVGSGAILGAVISGLPAVGRRPAPAMTALLGAAGVGLVLFALARTPLLALPALALVGCATIGFLAIANASIQLAVPHAIVGRVMGVWVVVNSGLIPVGSLLVGTAAEGLTVSVAIGLSGALCLATAMALVLATLVGVRRAVNPPAAPANALLAAPALGANSPEGAAVPIGKGN